jgi:hypothetical protein
MVVGTAGRSRLIRLLLPAVLVLGAGTGTAYAAFPYGPPATAGGKDYRLPDSEPRPSDLGGKLDWMYSGTIGTDNATFASDPRELNGVRGAHLVDHNTTGNPHTAWETTTGRPEVTISVLDSGIKWNDAGAMNDLRKKVRLNKGELPVPLHDRGSPTEAGEKPCAQFANAYDANGDGVFNIVDYACDSRVSPSGGPQGQPNLLDPQDVLVAFTDKTDADHNGYVDDIVGWDFLDNDNDPYDDVQYGHGTGEARDSSGEANNGNDLGSCPNCQVIPLRVGDSFVADVNRFAQAVTYAVDNDVLVVQEALGSLNNSTLATQAIDYAYNHGVTVIASAADEAAQHNNWPSSNPHVILVNSVTQGADQNGVPLGAPSYLSFNGCTNFNSKITLAIPSVSCSSDATGRASGMAGLIYSAAMNAHEASPSRLGTHPSCKRANGDPCLLSANEVRQLMATGTFGGTPQADDVDFAQGGELACPAPGCTDPFAAVPTTVARIPGAPPATSQSYPARKGHDQFYGYGRVNMDHAATRADAGELPPEAEIESPDWYSMVDPAKGSLDVRGHVAARSGNYTCKVYVAPGSYPNNSEAPAGDFKQVGGASQCDGTARQGSFDGVLATLDLNDLKSRYPPSTTANGPMPLANAASHSGRPNPDPYGFVVKVVTTAGDRTGEDRRNLRLHHDPALLPGFPHDFGGDGASSPLFVDLDGDNRNELVIAGSDGFVHAYRRDLSELPGWPVRGDQPPLHTGSHAFKSGEVSANVGGAILASVASGDLNGDGVPEVVAADMEGKVYAWNAQGQRVFSQEANPKFSGKPLQPFETVRNGHRFRTQHGFIASPVLADLDKNDGGKLEIIAAGMDRHVYAWNDDGSAVPGFPVLLVDRKKISAVDPVTHAPTFDNAKAGDELNQGAIVDTPAVGNIAGDSRPEIVVGTNEEYKGGDEPPVNAANFNGFAFSFLGPVLGGGNGRLYAIKPEGDADGNPMTDDFKVSDGWPMKIGLLQLELLPVVGEGVTGSPIIGKLACNGGAVEPKIGAVPDAGPAYILNPDGKSCLGQDSGMDRPLQSAGGNGIGQTDNPVVPAFGQPAFANLDPASDVSFLMPAAGLTRALDVVLPEYQGGQDFLGVWSPQAGGQFRPNFPATMNDLQFLAGPAIADLDGNPGEEIVNASASLDIQGFNAAGAPIDATWPKLSSDWVVNVPLIGTWGQLATDSDAKKVLFAITRAGFMLPYKTGAGPCAAASWPRFHHDNANSGTYGTDLGRDAVAPGKPTDLSVSGAKLSWKAPGDDLLCGKADHYEVVASDGEISARSFRAEHDLPGPPKPDDPGKTQTMAVPIGAQSYGIRAVDEQGNRGRLAVVSRGSGPSGSNPLSAGGVLDKGRSSCLARRARFTKRGIGRLRLGDTKARMLGRAGAPRVRRSRTWRYCVRGGGRALVAFDGHGRAVLVASTAKGHRIGRIHAGSRNGALQRAAPGLHAIGRGVRTGSRRYRTSIFGVKGGKVRFVGVAIRGLIGHRRSLGPYVKRLGL